jgi:uroporphyrinogen-III synthase
VKAATLVVVRPEPGNAATVAAAREMGCDVHGEPLFEIVATSWESPSAGEFDAVLIGSANALRHGGPALAGYAPLPAYVVGKATAQAALEAGFSVAATGSGGLQSLVAALAQAGRKRVLRLAGAEHVALDAGSEMTIETVVMYEAVPLGLSPAGASLLRTGVVAMLHSAAAARHFAAECERAGIERGTIALACLGPRIAAAAGAGWATVASAERPDDTALLALAARMCQTANFGDTDDND